ncbi:hypothetical protein CMUST_12375 [Corynebacterium mustelae]|uniref:Uncharacterized protein n=1 Tax=Corynebacterium mustelae TaxID=571915 RepID=A0A0G3H051_9CORY|nr:hypothetical protein [Corynebacterium mustelae]AKK06781.1 hypothetical protein CMUST_12375 [Corynebacterium mustelae]
MSISRNFDEYLAAHGIVQSAEVVPDNPCQVFEPSTQWYVPDVDAPNRGEADGVLDSDEWESAERIISQILGD